MDWKVKVVISPHGEKFEICIKPGTIEVNLSDLQIKLVSINVTDSDDICPIRPLELSQGTTISAADIHYEIVAWQHKLCCVKSSNVDRFQTFSLYIDVNHLVKPYTIEFRGKI